MMMMQQDKRRDMRQECGAMCASGQKQETRNLLGPSTRVREVAMVARTGISHPFCIRKRFCMRDDVVFRSKR